MVKSNKVKIYNNSESTYQVTEGEKDKAGLLIVINIPPKTSIELSEKEAKRLLSNYPKDFLEGGSVQDQAKGLKEKDQRIVELKASAVADKQALKDYIEKIVELEARLNSIQDSEHSIADLEAKLEASEKAKEKAEEEVKGLNDLIDSAQEQHKAPSDNKASNK